MKLDSKIFDGIRIRPRQGAAPKVEGPLCAWEGCKEPGVYRAPKGNHAVGEYHNFCLEHVRHYNHVFNFFAGMKPEDAEAHVMNERQTDGRPSWGFGAKPGSPGPKMPRGTGTTTSPDGKRRADPLNVFARYARSQARGPQKERVKPLLEQDRRALETLGIHGHAKVEEIKQAYKKLVKIHHPDANGGDKASEDRLRAIIAAYTHLKAKGFVGR